MKQGDMALALQMYEEGGTTVPELCQIAGVSIRNFYIALRKTDIPRRKRGSRKHVNVHVRKKRQWMGDDGEWTNLRNIQRTYGMAFVQLANRILSGEVGFGI